MKHARDTAAVAVWNGKIFVSGGHALYDLKSTECFDPESGVWTELTEMPTALAYHSLVAYGNLLICLGGSNETMPASPVFAMQKGGKWMALPPKKYPCGWFSGIAFNGEIYAIGGREESGSDHPRVELFDGERWRDGPSLPFICYQPSCIIISQQVADRLCTYYNEQSYK